MAGRARARFARGRRGHVERAGAIPPQALVVRARRHARLSIRRADRHRRAAGVLLPALADDGVRIGALHHRRCVLRMVPARAAQVGRDADDRGGRHAPDPRVLHRRLPAPARAQLDDRHDLARVHPAPGVYRLQPRLRATELLGCDRRRQHQRHRAHRRRAGEAGAPRRRGLQRPHAFALLHPPRRRAPRGAHPRADDAYRAGATARSHTADLRGRRGEAGPAFQLLPGPLLHGANHRADVDDPVERARRAPAGPDGAAGRPARDARRHQARVVLLYRLPLAEAVFGYDGSADAGTHRLRVLLLALQ